MSLSIRIIPCLDVDNGRVVKGINFINLVDAGDPVEMAKKYEVNGLVMHSNRSCKPYSVGQMDIMDIVRERTGLPVLMIEADMIDPRSFSQSQIETRIDAFMEIIKIRR